MRKRVCHDLLSLSGWPSETQKTRSRSRREDKVCVLQLVLWIRPMPHIRDNPAISQHQGGPTLLPTSWWRTSPLTAAIFIWIPDLFYSSWNKSLVKSIEILCPIFGLLYMYISLIFFFFFNFSLCKTNHIIGFTCHYRSSINYKCSMFYGAVQWPLSKTLPCELFCMANYRKLIRKLKGRQSTGEHLWTDLWDLL